MFDTVKGLFKEETFSNVITEAKLSAKERKALPDSSLLWGHGTRGLFSGGYDKISGIDYITTTTASNAVSFGSIGVGRFCIGTSSNESEGFMGGGFNTANVRNLEKITFSTLSNASSLTELSESGSGPAIHNKTIALFSFNNKLFELNMSTKALSSFGQNSFDIGVLEPVT
jgi:hypothetical protein